VTRRADRLDPVRFSAPRPFSLIRAAAVAVLLCLAAATLYVEQPGPGSPAVADGRPAGAVRPSLPSGLVGVPVRLADPAALAVVRPGDRVDLLRLPGDPGAAPSTVATAVLVLDAVSGLDVPVLYLAMTAREAGAAAVAGPDTRFGVIVRAQ